MALTGFIYELTDEELHVNIRNGFKNLEALGVKTDISYFLIDFMEIMESYSGFEKRVFRKILEGCHFYKSADGFIGYSFAEEIKLIKEQTIDYITVDDFDFFLQKGLLEKHPFTSIENNAYIRKYFSTIKNAYGLAVDKNMALIFQIG